MLTATCHCGAVRIEVPAAPATTTDCNCSICRRYGTLWAYYPDGYVRGDRTLRFVRCRACGCWCVTHWERIVRRLRRITAPPPRSI